MHVEPAAPEIAETVNRGLAAQRRLHLTYDVPSRDETTERDVDPMRLVVSEGRTYLEAWCRLAEDVRFEDIAREVGLAPRSLARRFEDESGMTWRAVLRRMRVLRAIEELAAGEESVTAIAHTVGYTSLSAFNAGFRDLTGRTPTQYRATFRP